MVLGQAMNYDHISKTYDQHRGWEEAIPLRLLEVAVGTRLQLGLLPLLEVGCGTGNVTQWLKRHWSARVIGLDASAGMLTKAQQKLNGVDLLRADARHLPIAESSIAGCVGSFVLHHLDKTGRAKLFAELQRVIVPSGGLAFLTSSHSQIRRAWLARWFPVVAAIDCARFADIPELSAELSAAGFSSIHTEVVTRENAKGDATHIAKARARFISTLDLVPPAEFDAGLARMEVHLAQHGDLGDVGWQATIVGARK
jgi:SAM-dependent methyltransferase